MKRREELNVDSVDDALEIIFKEWSSKYCAATQSTKLSGIIQIMRNERLSYSILTTVLLVLSLMKHSLLLYSMVVMGVVLQRLHNIISNQIKYSFPKTNCFSVLYRKQTQYMYVPGYLFINIFDKKVFIPTKLHRPTFHHSKQTTQPLTITLTTLPLQKHRLHLVL